MSLSQNIVRGKSGAEVICVGVPADMWWEACRHGQSRVTMIGPARDIFQFVHDRSERHPVPEDSVVLLLRSWSATLDDEVCVDEVV
jgi:hypothetical protein